MLRPKTIFLCLCSLVTTSLLINTTYPPNIFRLMALSLSMNSSTTEHVLDGPIHAGETERLKKANDALPWLSHPLLPRLLSRQERDRCIELLSTVDAILQEFNITYTLAHGTLLGSYVMHDMLPWDDDLDIFMNIDDIPKMKRLFNASGSGHFNLMIQRVSTVHLKTWENASRNRGTV